jgi:hypothetical protein
MKAVWKYPLSTKVGQQEVVMPVDARILCLQVQNDVPTLWAEVDTTQGQNEARRFCTVLTGFSAIPDKHVYVGTFQLDGGAFVGHVFEIRATTTDAGKPYLTAVVDSPNPAGSTADPHTATNVVLRVHDDRPGAPRFTPNIPTPGA